MVAIVAAAPGCLATIVSFLNNAIARRNARHLEETKAAIVTLEHNTNSIKDALVKVTGESEFQRGLKIGTEGTVGVAGPIGPRGEKGPRGDHG